MLNHYLAHWPSTNRSLMRPTLAEFVEELASMRAEDDMPECFHVAEAEMGIDGMSVDARVRAALDEYLAEAQSDTDHKRSCSGEL